MYYIVKDDREAGYGPGKLRPFLREGLPSTVRIEGGKGFVMLSSAWMSYARKINDTPGKKYQFADWPFCRRLRNAVGWHNTGKGNRVEQLTFSGNIVDVLYIDGNKAYIRCWYNDQKPPSFAHKPMPGNLNPLVQLLTTQFSNRLDMGTNGKYPRTFIIANGPLERLWIDAGNLKPMPPFTESEPE